ncbi:MAG: aminotransferase, partial [Clostridia bacterium]
MDYKTLSLSDLKATLEDEQKSFKKLQKKAITVDMTRGRPSKEQLKIAMPMLENAGTYNYDLAGGDARNYGGLGGTKDAKALFAEILDVKTDEVIVGDGSSLDLMYMLVHFAMQFGVLGGTPWNKIKKIKFICPAPGYDRHFAICAQFGIDMITVPMRADGPDMDMIEGLVK